MVCTRWPARALGLQDFFCKKACEHICFGIVKGHPRNWIWILYRYQKMMGLGKCTSREISGGVYTFLFGSMAIATPKRWRKVRSHDKLGGMGVAPSILSRWCIHPTEFANTTISIKNLPFLKAVEVPYLPCKITPSWVSGINDFPILLLINPPNSNSTGVKPNQMNQTQSYIITSSKSFPISKQNP